MNVKCPKCGSNMVEKDPDIIYTTYPECWDRVLWCACGYSENHGIVYGKTKAPFTKAAASAACDEILMDRWKEANK